MPNIIFYLKRFDCMLGSRKLYLGGRGVLIFFLISFGFQCISQRAIRTSLENQLLLEGVHTRISLVILHGDLGPLQDLLMDHE